MKLKAYFPWLSPGDAGVRTRPVLETPHAFPGAAASESFMDSEVHCSECTSVGFDKWYSGHPLRL